MQHSRHFIIQQRQQQQQQQQLDRPAMTAATAYKDNRLLQGVKFEQGCEPVQTGALDFTFERDPLGLKACPDTELFDFLEDLNTDGWFFEPSQQQQPTKTLTGGKRAFSAMTDATDVCSTEYIPANSPASKSTLSTCTSSWSQASEAPETHEEIPIKSPRSGSRMTAMEIFHIHTKWYTDPNGKLYVDASGIISRECYEQWLASRKKMPNRPEETFRKSILCHCTSSDGGSAPFQPEVELSLLKLLRQSGKVWPCFRGQIDKDGKPVNIGLKGLRATGYHEKKAQQQSPAAKRARA